MFELLALAPFQKALAGLVATGLAYPLLGVVVLNLELLPARFAVMHASLLGAALALAAGLDPAGASVLAAIATGLGVARLSERGTFSAGGPLGLVMALSLGLAFIVFYKANIHAIEAFNLFWGNVLALSWTDLGFTAASAGLILALTAVFFKEIQAVLYDRELARALGLPARGVYYGLIVATCLGIGLAMRLTGALMVDALTILPAFAARPLARSLAGLCVLSGVFGLVMNLGGLGLALAFDLPVSPAIIVFGSSLCAAAQLAARARRPAA